MHHSAATPSTTTACTASIGPSRTMRPVKNCPSKMAATPQPTPATATSAGERRREGLQLLAADAGALLMAVLSPGVSATACSGPAPDDPEWPNPDVRIRV